MTITLKVDGMTCGGCVRSVEGVLAAIDGVTAARADLVAGTAQVTTARPVDPALLVAAVEEAGFEARVTG